MTDFTDEQLVAKHIEIKRYKDALDDAHKKKNAELNRMLQAIEGLINVRILAKGPSANNLITPSGTAFQRTLTYCRVVDDKALERYVRETGDFSFIDLDVKRDGVEAFMEKTGGHTPPGVTVTKVKQTVTRE